MSSTSTSPKDAMLAAPLPGSEQVSAIGISSRATERRVGKYHILAELGRGGTATVYLAVARGAGGVSKLVVLKALLPEYAGQSGAVSSFLDEARLAALLNHPNVVQTYEVGTEANHSVIVMEYLEGQSLSRLTRSCEVVNRRLPDGMHFKILIELLAGLHYAHELKSYEGVPLDLVHRDVSPQNVFVTYDGQVKVLDFGIAKASTSSTQTASGVLKGKISYMAPEQMSGSPVDRRADVFSVGCMLWAAAAGTKLWKDYSYVQIVRHVLAGKIPSPRHVNPYCPEDLEHIVMKALAQDPADRYATAFDLQMALESFTESHGLTAKRREIGALVTQLFAETRAELQASIERELAARVTADSPNCSPSERRPSSSRAPVSFPKATQNHLSTGRAPRTRWLLSSAFAVGLLASAGTVLLGRRAFEELRAHRSDAPLLAAAHEAAASVKLIAAPSASAPVPFQVAASTAERSSNGVALVADAADPALPVDGKTHELSVAVPGRASKNARRDETRSDTLRVGATPMPSGSARRGLGVRRDTPANRRDSPASSRAVATLTSAARTQAPPTTAGTASDAPTTTAGTASDAPTTNGSATEPVPQAPGCRNPFYVDLQGIKRVRTECL